MLLNKRSYWKFVNATHSFKSYLFTLTATVLLTILIIYLTQTQLSTENKHNYHQKNKKPKPNQKLSETDIVAFPLVREFELNSGIKKFDNENARTVGFPLKENENRNSSSTKIIYLATKYFGQWNLNHYYSLHLGHATFARYPCAVNDCYATSNPRDIQRADAVLFHVRDLEILTIPRYRSPEQTYILYSMEPPWLEIVDMRRFNGFFNWTMSYRRESDVLVKYGFIGRPQQRGTPSESLSWRTSFQGKQDRAVWFVTNCKSESNREGYVARLMKVYPVDVFGGCGKEGCRPAETEKCYRETEGRYKFYLSFENALCRDYVTEKLYNPLGRDIIPVTFGGADYSRVAPPNSVISAMEFESPEALGEYLWRVSRNETLYLSYFAWKGGYRSYLQPWMCDLCEKLHGDRPAKTNRDLESWWTEGGSCLSWSEERGFAPVKVHPFPQYHTKIFG